MTPFEIHQHLSEKFPCLLSPWEEPKAGDPFLLVRPEGLHQVCAYLRSQAGLEFNFLRLITAIDCGTALASVYHLYSLPRQHAVTLWVNLSRDNPRISTVTDLWPAANWLERECFDMMGIVYDGHPDLRRILLPADWDGFPLRKDYKAPDSYHGIGND